MTTPFDMLHDTLISISVRTDFGAETLTFTRPGGSTFTLACQVFDVVNIEDDRTREEGKTSVKEFSASVSNSEYLAAATVAPENGTKITRGGADFYVWRIVEAGHFTTLYASNASPTDTRADGSQIWGGR